MYTSKMAIVEFVNALNMGGRVLLKWLHKAPLFSIMADECTDVTTIEELTICCCWVEWCTRRISRSYHDILTTVLTDAHV